MQLPRYGGEALLGTLVFTFGLAFALALFLTVLFEVLAATFGALVLAGRQSALFLALCLAALLHCVYALRKRDGDQ